MLYLSRSFHDDSFGVVDTDTDVEAKVSFNELINMAVKCNIKIEGVQIGNSAVKNLAFISSITAYQDPKYYSKEQAKLKTLFGIDICTFRGEIVNMVIDGDVFPGSLNVRLSKYGKMMDGRTNIGWHQHKDGQVVTLVLDDNLNIVGEAPFVGLKGIRWDVSEVSDEKLIREMYMQLATEGVSDMFWHNFIIDSKNRVKNRGVWRALYQQDNKRPSD